MKILLLIPNVANGGAEKILSDLSQGLESDEVVVVVFENRIDYPIRGKLLSLDLPIRSGVLNRLLGLFRRTIRFRRVLRAERPDVVLSFMGEANILNALLSPRPIVTVHNHLSTLGKLARGPMETFFSNFLVRMLYGRTTVVAVSNMVKRDLVEKFRVSADRVVVIPNVVNSRVIQEKATEPAICPWKSGLPVIITAGRLTKQKGQWHLIRAFAIVRKEIPCQLAILGAGELEEELKELARTAGVDQDVYFLGWQSNPWKFLAKAQLFVLPSLTEGYPLILLEAMVCGLPVISTDCPGASREILSPRTANDSAITTPEYADYGVLVPVGSEETLAEAMLRLLRDVNVMKHYVESGGKRIRDFDYDLFIDRYRQVMESVVKSCQRV